MLRKQNQKQQQQQHRHPVVFVAMVQSIEEASNNDVTNSFNAVDGSMMTTVYHLTVSRRGVTDEQEALVVDLSRRVRRLADCIVDRAADEAKVSRFWARRVALYGPYHDSLRVAMERDGEDYEEEEEESYIVAGRAAEHLLIHVIGRLPPDDVDGVQKHLKFSPKEHNTVGPKKISFFYGPAKTLSIGTGKVLQTRPTLRFFRHWRAEAYGTDRFQWKRSC